jgi:hypothetical protein
VEIVLKTDCILKIKDIFKNTEAGTLVLLDVDDTLITPKANIFSYKNNSHRTLIDDIIANKHRISNFTRILSNWRLQRKIVLVSCEWPSIIESMKQNRVSVFALTQIDTGQFGCIRNLERWRYRELKRNGIVFSRFIQGKSRLVLKKDKNGYAVFYNGVIMTGPFEKVEIFNELLRYVSAKKIIFVDDREENILSLYRFVKNTDILFTGIIFRGVEKCHSIPSDEISNLQKKYLLEKAIWLEDDEAKLLLSRHDHV